MCLCVVFDRLSHFFSRNSTLCICVFVYVFVGVVVCMCAHVFACVVVRLLGCLCVCLQLCCLACKMQINMEILAHANTTLICAYAEVAPGMHASSMHMRR